MFLPVLGGEAWRKREKGSFKPLFCFKTIRTREDALNKPTSPAERGGVVTLLSLKLCW